MDTVIAISIDGLPVRALEQNFKTLPNLQKLKTTGYSTHNARTDYNLTITMPNHMSMVTSRPVYDNKRCLGHKLTKNRKIKKSVQDFSKTGYVNSIFDVLRKNKVPFRVYLNKEKLEILCRSFKVEKKLCYIDDSTERESQGIPITRELIQDIKQDKFRFYFIHYAATDNMGHHYGWVTDEYIQALQDIDKDIGLLLEALQSKKNYAIILTTDHGGYDLNHGESDNPLNFTIPFYLYFSDQVCKELWCYVERQRDNKYTLEYEELEEPQRLAIQHILKNIGKKNMSLYEFLKLIEPASDRNPKYEDTHQPIRNGILGNLVTRLFLLPLIDDACIGMI